MKHNHYVAIITDNGLKYVTRISNRRREAHWDACAPALKLSQSVADDVCYGLLFNGYQSIVIRVPSSVSFTNGYFAE